MKAALYSELDPYAAQWLRNLIAADLIAAGDVDERDVRDLIPTELMGRRQVHLFAGIGCWSYALRLAGWPDERAVWTVSCPCQPFSAAGKGGGFADERHLWPAAFHLIRECRPVAVFGEQVASPDGLLWFDLVSADLESCGYTVGAAVLPACGVGAPHQRHRLWFVADAEREQLRAAGPGRPERAPGAVQGADGQRQRLRDDAGERGSADGLGHAPERGQRVRGGAPGSPGRPAQSEQAGSVGNPGSARLPAREREALLRAGRRGEGRTVVQPGGASGGLADAEGARGRTDAGTVCGGEGTRLQEPEGQDLRRSIVGTGDPGGSRTVGGERPGPLNGFWRSADWLFCTDGLWRPVAPGSFPLGNGIANRVAQLRAAGNAIVPEVAAEFIGAYREVREAL